MYEEQLFAAAPSRCRLNQGPSLASRSLGESFSPTFFHLGVHWPLPWLLGTAVAISQSQNWLVLWWRVSTPFPLSLGQLVFVEGCGFVVCCSGHRAFRPGCPLGLHECGRADDGAAEVAAIAQSPRSTWRGLAELRDRVREKAPEPRDSAGRVWGHCGVTGLGIWLCFPL